MFNSSADDISKARWPYDIFEDVDVTRSNFELERRVQVGTYSWTSSCKYKGAMPLIHVYVNSKIWMFYIIWSWYIYEIKVHIEYVHCHKFETKLSMVHNHNLGNLCSVKVHSLHLVVNRGGKSYTLTTANVPTIRIG